MHLDIANPLLIANRIEQLTFNRNVDDMGQ
jgi:hypothetical protein